MTTVYLDGVNTTGDHPLFTNAKKLKHFTIPHCEYATVEFGTYPLSIAIHAYTKWFIAKKEKLSTPPSFIFILKKRDWLKSLE